MAKIKVEICVGTTCHILGASRLQHLEDFLPEGLKGKVDITGSHCLNACKNDNFGSAPFVRIDGVVMGNASIDRIIAKLYELI